MHLEISTRENGLMIQLMDMGYILIQMVQSTKGNGLMIANMVMEKKVGTMDRLSILASFTKERKMAKEDLNGKMVVFMMEILSMVFSKAMVKIILFNGF